MPGQTGPKRSKTEREVYLARLDTYERRGFTQSRIASIMGVSQPQVSNDIKILRKRRVAATLDTDAYTMAMRLAEVREEAYTAWEKSKEDSEKITTTDEQNICDACDGAGEVLKGGEEVICPKCSGEGYLHEKKVTTTRAGRLPDPNYLKIVRETYADERELLGLDVAPKRPEGVNVNINNSQSLTLNFDMLCERSQIVDPVEEKIAEVLGGGPPPAPEIGLKELPPNGERKGNGEVQE